MPSLRGQLVSSNESWGVNRHTIQCICCVAASAGAQPMEISAALWAFEAREGLLLFTSHINIIGYCTAVAVCMWQLINTKTQDGKQTLMHFLADCIEKRFPDVMDFASELIHVEKAARGQWLYTHMMTTQRLCGCLAVLKWFSLIGLPCACKSSFEWLIGTVWDYELDFIAVWDVESLALSNFLICG